MKTQDFETHVIEFTPLNIPKLTSMVLLGTSTMLNVAMFYGNDVKVFRRMQPIGSMYGIFTYI